MSGHFPLSVESKLEAFVDEREARSRRGSVPRNKEQRIKLLMKTPECWRRDPFLMAPLYNRFFKNVVLKGLKPANNLQLDSCNKLTNNLSKYDCPSSKGCCFRTSRGGIFSLTLFPPFNVGCQFQALFGKHAKLLCIQ